MRFGLFTLSILLGCLFALILATSGNYSTHEVIKLDKKFGESTSLPASEVKYKPIIKLKYNDEFFCTAFVIDKNYAVTAGHCVNNNGRLTKDTLQVFSDEDKDTGVKIKAAGMALRSDLGLLVGDFSQFTPLKADFHKLRFNEPGYYVCGFPYGQSMACTPFTPIQNMGFGILGQGYIVPGQSGSPVISVLTGEAVGVGSASEEPGILVYPLLGLLGAFNIE